MNRRFPLLALMVVFFLSGCMVIRNLRPDDNPGPDEGIAFGRFIVRFDGHINSYYTLTMFQIFRADAGPDSGGKPVKVIEAYAGKKVEGFVLKPGRYRIGKYAIMNYQGHVFSKSRTFTVEAGKSNYIGTFLFVINGDTQEVTFKYVVGENTEKRARRAYRRRFPELANRYPFRLAFTPPAKGVKEEDTVPGQGRW